MLSCDEKCRVQALDRTQPGLPLKKGRAATMTHDYKRHGTTTLFAALNVLNGRVIAQCRQRHRHIEWLRFLRQIDRLGRSLDYTWRYTIDPYLHYRKEDDLYIIHMCVTSKTFPASFYYKCFVVDS